VASAVPEGMPGRARNAITHRHVTLLGHTTRRRVTSDKTGAVGGAQKMERDSLVLPLLNCNSVLKKSLEFRNVIDTYNPYIIIGLESWLLTGI
jgi:hypothetical protein